MKPKFFFDYIFYRVTEVYLNWKDGGGGVDTGVISVTLIQCFTLSSVLGIISRILYNRTETAPHAKTISAVAVGVFTVLYILNSIRYKKDRYESLKVYWKDEPLSRRKLKGFLVVLSIILPIVPLILVGVYW
jgi:uncharacterized BrkB/YihY/UPF0761 family membrane protein